MSNAKNKSTQTQNAPATGLSTEAKKLLKAVGEASHASDTARGLQTRANKNAAIQLKADGVHSDYLSSPFAKENPELTFRRDALHMIVSGKPAIWSQLYFAFEDDDKKSKLDKGDNNRVLVGVNNDGIEVYKSEYDAATHFRGQVISNLGAVARALRDLEGNDPSSGTRTKKENHLQYMRTMLQDFHDAEILPTGYTDEGDAQRIRSMIETAYKIDAGKPWEPKKK
jgi:hypothetical protein